MLNNITLMGRLTATPELRNTESDKTVTSFCIAIERDYSNSDGTKETDFINIVAWRQTADFICKYFTKGQLIAITGSLQISKYEKDGETRKKAEVIARQAYFADSKKTDSEKPPEDVSVETADNIFQNGNPFNVFTNNTENVDTNENNNFGNDGFFPFE